MDEPPPTRPTVLMTLVRANRRPTVLLAISVVFLALQHTLLRAMAHGHIAHVLLGVGNAPPPTGAAVLAISLLVVRFVSYIIVPGLLLAVAAELVAYVLVGPKRDGGEEEDSLSVLDADE